MARMRFAVSVLVSMLIVIVITSSLISLHVSHQTKNGFDFNNGKLTASSSQFEVTFNETGLTNQTWFVTFNSITVNTTKSSFHFYVLPGNYSFSVSGPFGYSLLPENGSISVTNKSTEISIVFTKMAVFNFYMKGLPIGDQWSILINGTLYSTKNSSIIVALPTGIYTYKITLPLFYKASDSSGVIGPDDGSVTVQAIHQPTEYIIIIVLLVVIDAVLIVLFVKRRNKSRSLAT